MSIDSQPFNFICVLHFSELLQSLEMCENDPVAIALCFVDKVSVTICLAVISASRITTVLMSLSIYCVPRVKTLKSTPSIAPTIPSKRLENIIFKVKPEEIFSIADHCLSILLQFSSSSN